MPHKQYEQQLDTLEISVSLDTIAMLFGQANVSLIIANSQGHVLNANEQACKLLGYTLDELLNCTWYDLIEQKTFPNHQVDLRHKVITCHLRTKSGYTIAVELMNNWLNESIQVTIINDLEKQIRQQQNELVARIVDQTSDVIGSLAIDPDGKRRFLYFNSAIESIGGLSIEQLLNDPNSFFDRIHPDDQHSYNEALSESARTMQPMQVQFRFLHPERGEIWFECNAQPHYEANHTVVWYGFLREITEHKEVERQLLYQTNVVYNVSDAIIVTNLDGLITSWNYAATALYGWSATEVIGMPIEQIIATALSDDISITDIYNYTFTHGQWKGEIYQRRKDGTEILVVASVVVVKDSFGRPNGAVAIYRDVSELRRAEEARLKLEEQLNQAQKMESLGRLVGGVAHNFNNLLSVILGYTDLILDQLPDNAQIRDDFEQIRIASERAVTLTRHLLAIGRRQMLSPTVFDVGAQIVSLHKMLEQLIGEDIILKLDLPPDLWHITADPSQIEQVLMNLLINARDAMPIGGTLTIRARNVPSTDLETLAQFDIAPTDCVLISVIDTGHGIEPQTLSHIFEPFFTTKPQGQGTGLGLASVYGIIKQSGGGIAVESVVNQGTVFNIVLPASIETEPVDGELQLTEHVVLGGHETILLVEDEAQVRFLARNALRELGYHVLEAQNGLEALVLAQQHTGTIDLLVTDVVMPQLSGRMLAKSLRLMQPQLRVLYMSGYTDDMMIRHGVIEEEIEFLAKPFSNSQLTAKVRELLDRPVHQ